MLSLLIALPIAVRLYDTTAASPAELRQATAIAGAILSSAGLEAAWRECPGDCGDPIQPAELVIRIVNGAGRGVGMSLGYAHVETGQRAGTLATIFADRLASFADAGSVARAVVFGRVMAHEIGHLLLGTPGHARRGLMRAAWMPFELRRDVPSDWSFSRNESVEMRRNLANRAVQGQNAALSAEPCVPCTPCRMAGVVCKWPS